MPCQHKGICTPVSFLHFECDCPKGYYGETCEKATFATWLKDKFNLDRSKKHKMTTTGKLIWGLINSIPLLHDAALSYLFLGRSSLGSHDSHIWQNYHPYTNLEGYHNRTYMTRGLPPVPKECPTPLGIKGPRHLPPAEEVFSLLLERKEFKPCPLGTNLMFVTFAQYLACQFFKVSFPEEEFQTSEEVVRKALRSWANGKLKARIINGEEYPPYLEDVPEVAAFYSLKPEKEVYPQWALPHKMLAETPLTFAMSTIWLREHNRVCDILAKEHPEWNDERIYQTTRWIVLGELITITTGEYFQHLAQSRLKLQYKPQLFHRKTLPSSVQMRHEFGLVFQWGLALPDVLSIHGTRYNFSDLTFGNNRVVFEHGLDAIVDSMSRHPAGQVVYRNCGKNFKKTMKKLIEEGRRSRLHSLNDYRRFYGLKPYKSFEELVDDENVVQTLEKLYGEVDAVEFLVGLLVEKHEKSVVPPSAVQLAGPVALREILTSPVGSSALWRPSTFGGKTGFEIVQKATLRKLFCSNLRGNCRNNVWVSFKTPADVTALSKKINAALTNKK